MRWCIRSIALGLSCLVWVGCGDDDTDEISGGCDCDTATGVPARSWLLLLVAPLGWLALRRRRGVLWILPLALALTAAPGPAATQALLDLLTEREQPARDLEHHRGPRSGVQQ